MLEKSGAGRERITEFWSRERATRVLTAVKETKRRKAESVRKGGEKEQGATEFGRRNSSNRMGKSR